MKAIVLRELGSPANVRLEEMPDPTPGPGEVVVRLRAAALNHRDVWICKGMYPGVALPAILGSDGAGQVAALGEGVEGPRIGQDVIINPSLDWGGDDRVQGDRFRILGMPDHGTFAELIKVPAENVHAKPAGLTFEQAAAIPLAGLTAYPGRRQPGAGPAGRDGPRHRHRRRHGDLRPADRQGPRGPRLRHLRQPREAGAGPRARRRGRRQLPRRRLAEAAPRPRRRARPGDRQRRRRGLRRSSSTSSAPAAGSSTSG